MGGAIRPIIIDDQLLILFLIEFTSGGLMILLPDSNVETRVFILRIRVEFHLGVGRQERNS